jgi:hypothetical protein
MELIYYRGLNCHLASLINIAAVMGINYDAAYATLWSETDFYKDREHHLFTSKRVIENLESLGLKWNRIDTAASENESECLAATAVNELLFVGMDTFYIPWNHLYGNFHETHYFYACKDSADACTCFDPTYHIINQPLSLSYLAEYAFELCSVRKQAGSGLSTDLSREADMILQTHPEIRSIICSKILSCADLTDRDFKELIQLVTAMINNRYLFDRYLRYSAEERKDHRQYFKPGFLSGWEAVKNGLYKAYIVKNKDRTAAETAKLFEQQMAEETMIAEAIKRS